MLDVIKAETEIVNFLQSYGHHCTTTIRDDFTLILSDCSTISYKELDFLLQRFACDDIYIENSSMSKSGFIVIISFQRNTSFFQSSHFLQLFFVLLIYVFFGIGNIEFFKINSFQNYY